MKQPVDHVLRPQLPWRSGPGITECGLDASKISTLTRAQFFERRKDLGQQRCAMLTCMTCSDTARRWGEWEDDPRKAMEREILWETAWHRVDRGDLLRDELCAIQALVTVHADEFAATLADMKQRRDWLAMKAAHVASRKAKP